MATKTKSVTRAAVLAAAKRKWPGDEVWLRELVGALNAETRPLRKERKVAVFERLSELAKIIKAGDKLRLQLEAAEFWRDVDGGEPSTTRLRQAVADARAYAELLDEAAELERERHELAQYVSPYRWELMHRSPGRVGWNADVHCDTLEEGLAKIEATP